MTGQRPSVTERSRSCAIAFFIISRGSFYSS